MSGNAEILLVGPESMGQRVQDLAEEALQVGPDQSLGTLKLLELILRHVI